MANSIRAEIEGGDDLDRFLAQLPFEMRRKILPKAIRAGGNVVNLAARERIRDPGYPGDKPGLVPLKKTIITKVKVYDMVVVAIVGPHYMGGNHGHLVEFGHRLIRKIKTRDGVEKVEIGFVPPHPFLRPAADETRDEQLAAITGLVWEEIQQFQQSMMRAA